MRAYHLSGVQFAISNIALRRLKISRFRDLNDPFELAGADATDPNIRESFERSRARLDKNFGCICFSRAWSDPVLWAHYAEKHYGIALGFDIDDECMKPIDYISKPFSLEQEHPGAKPKIDIDVAYRWLFTKFKGWKYEKEVRASFKLDHKSQQAGLYFAEFSEKVKLREVILGVRCELPLIEVQQLVSTFAHPVTVIKARIAFDRFRVERDERVAIPAANPRAAGKRSVMGTSKRTSKSGTRL